jgi:hypothetical protein
VVQEAQEYKALQVQREHQEQLLLLIQLLMAEYLEVTLLKNLQLKL